MSRKRGDDEQTGPVTWRVELRAAAMEATGVQPCVDHYIFCLQAP